jgi:hypothetical protein
MPAPPTVRRKSLNDRLADRSGQQQRTVHPTALLPPGQSGRLASSDEIAVTVTGALMVRKLAEFGQTRLYQRAADQLVERLTQGMTSQQVMELEIEAYELIDFLTGPEASGDTPAAAHRDGGRVLYDPNASVLDLVQRAVDESFDLRIDYFSRRRGEMNTRRITPREIKAETYVMAFCHARQSERVFRISRITRCVPIDGKPDRPSAPQRALQHESEPGPAQLSLLDDDTVSGD